MHSGTEHWNAAYAGGDDAVSWFQVEARTSLDLIESVTQPDASLIDVGGGSSRLVDGLIERGHKDLAVLDLADSALAISRERLGPRAADVDWIVANLLDWESPRSYDVWHDRAVLHFLTSDEQRHSYLAAMRTALRVGGHAVIGVFAADGPEQCSGLEVRRYSPEDLRALLGSDFEPVSSVRELHGTPGGNQQAFNWLVARRAR
ncbi:MAG: class I SAM-dependent methyltransferase [Thermoleophilaceae bacterium]|nr:class I SAM-dependent methyltransferase [Thermoleophilaceae bacterium]